MNRLVVDLSHHNGRIDWPGVTQTGLLTGCMVKATDGDTYTDPMLQENAQGAESVGLTAGFYHFFRPFKDARVQARHFAQAIPAHVAAAPLAVDLEWTSTGAGIQEDWKELKEDLRYQVIRDFLDELSKFWKGPVLRYLPPEFAREYLPGLNLSDGPLWTVDYKDGQLRPDLPPFFTAWTMWQRAPRNWIPGIPGKEDMDVLQDGVRFVDLSCTRTGLTF